MNLCRPIKSVVTDQDTKLYFRSNIQHLVFFRSRDGILWTGAAVRNWFCEAVGANIKENTPRSDRWALDVHTTAVISRELRFVKARKNVFNKEGFGFELPWKEDERSLRLAPETTL